MESPLLPVVAPAVSRRVEPALSINQAWPAVAVAHAQTCLALNFLKPDARSVLRSRCRLLPMASVHSSQLASPPVASRIERTSVELVGDETISLLFPTKPPTPQQPPVRPLTYNPWISDQRLTRLGARRIQSQWQAVPAVLLGLMFRASTGSQRLASVPACGSS